MQFTSFVAFRDPAANALAISPEIRCLLLVSQAKIGLSRNADCLSYTKRSEKEIPITRWRRSYNTAPSNLGITLRLLRTNPADHVRNIRLWMPGTENAGSLFHPEFKRRLAPFGVLRFMDPLSTNGNPQVTWSERRKPSNFFKSGANGMPYEFAVDLCNELQKDLWLNVPAKANDAFIDSLAALIKSRLNPGLRCWIEYSNETWNSNFTVQFQYTLALKDLWGLSSRPAAHGRRSVQIFDIFERVFGGTDRLVRIMAGQARNAWQLQEAMKEAASYCAPGPVRVDVASVAYYFTDKSTVNLIWNQRNNSNKDTIWADLYKQIDGDVGPVENMALATRYGIPMVGYEGGDHLNAVSQDDSLSAAQCDELAGYIADIVRNPRFVDVYKYALNRWYTIGATTPVAFVYCGGWSRYGQWGHLEHQTQPTDSAPKYKALLEWADSMTTVPVLPYAPSARAIGIANTQRHGFRGAIFDASGRMRMRFAEPSDKLLPHAPGLYISVPNGLSARPALTIR